MALRYFESMLSTICGGQYCATVHHFALDESSGPADDFVIAQQINTMWTDEDLLQEYMTMLAEDDCFASSLRTREVGAAGGNTAVETFSKTDYPGTFSGGVQAFQVAACFIWVTTGSDNVVGRTFIPGISTEAVVEGRFSPSFKTAANTFGDNYITSKSISAGPVVPIVFNRTLHAGQAITGGYVSPKVGTQRRREMPV